ncbi:hypothetical protein GCM10025881_01790 [Pseudolysinimonas kribbensis]|uniref:Uncharacterized protein n=1 Tax=Pseudolysinimonas kribbensis TaxID=433641 RepID=A0ABQ6K2S3_9MICO|nr:hypothetical protein GCM10025881_01790 [Pseudolysinimonas kribbensis]
MQSHDQGGDPLRLLVGDVGCDLDQDRHSPRLALHGLEQRRQTVELLQAAQARGVGRAHVDDQVVGVRREHAGARAVVVDRVVDLDHPALADVDADHRPRPPRTLADKTRRDLLGAVVVEAHAVDEGPVGHQPEQPGPGIAGLGARGHRADLDVAEAENTQAPDRAGLLVESGRHPEGRRELEAEGAHRERGGGPGERAERERQHRQHPDDEVAEAVGALRVETREDEPEQDAVHADARLSGAIRRRRPPRPRPRRAPPAGA